MKNPQPHKWVLISTLLFGLSFSLAGQVLEENKVDEFTKHSVKRTSWETLNSSMKFNAYFRISKIDDLIYFDLKMSIGVGEVFSIKKDQELMFKLANDSIVSLPNLEYALTCKGCGAKGYMGSAAHGIQVSYPINIKQIDLLKKEKVIKARVYTSTGYVEDELKDKNALKIKKALSLVE